jgi:hypothetical protein
MEVESINKIITEKSEKGRQKFIQRMQELGIHHGSEPLSNIKKTLTKNDGVINRIRYKFKRSGVFLQKGVGRGTPADKVGQTNRKAKDWFNSVVDEIADEITEAVADEWVDVIFDKLKIK